MGAKVKRLMNQATTHAERMGWRITGWHIQHRHDWDYYKGDFIVWYSTESGQRVAVIGNIYD